jgi:hypothetical protein
MRLVGITATLFDVNMTTAPSQQAHPAGYLSRWRERRRERLRLARQDRLTAQLAELHHIQTLIADARTLVASGWVQDGWFAYRDERGQQCTVRGMNLHGMADRPVTGACLVGAIAHAGGGLAALRTAPVQRALDVTWQTLYRDQHKPGHWCPVPTVRTNHVRDLTRWNDHSGRLPDEVTGLLHTAEQAAAAQIERLRA